MIENLLAVAPRATQAYFYRSAAGAEIDLVLELPRRQRWAIEVKRTSAPAASRGLHIAAADLKASRRFVYAGNESRPLAHGVRVTTLAELQRALVELGPSR